MVRQRVSFIGRVQGVGFRATARYAAGRFDVTGWVRNEPDGSVNLEVQGEPSEIEAFLVALRAEMAAFILAENRTPVQPQAGEHAFEIRR
jgi:acylphosphatase